MKLRNDSSEHVESAQLLTDRGRKRAGNSGMSGILSDTGSPGYKTMEDSGGGIKKLSGSRGSLTSGKGSRRPSVMSGLDDNGSDIVDKSRCGLLTIVTKIPNENLIFSNYSLKI